MERPLHNLRWLHIDFVNMLPTWINGASLPALSNLDVTAEHERSEDIQVLGTRPCLRHLTFRVIWHAKQEQLERSEVGLGAFPSAIS